MPLSFENIDKLTDCSPGVLVLISMVTGLSICNLDGSTYKNLIWHLTELLLSNASVLLSVFASDEKSDRTTKGVNTRITANRISIYFFLLSFFIYFILH